MQVINNKDALCRVYLIKKKKEMLLKLMLILVYKDAYQIIKMVILLSMHLIKINASN